MDGGSHHHVSRLLLFGFWLVFVALFCFSSQLLDERQGNETESRSEHEDAPQVEVALCCYTCQSNSQNIAASSAATKPKRPQGYLRNYSS